MGVWLLTLHLVWFDSELECDLEAFSHISNLPQQLVGLIVFKGEIPTRQRERGKEKQRNNTF